MGISVMKRRDWIISLWIPEIPYIPEEGRGSLLSFNSRLIIPAHLFQLIFVLDLPLTPPDAGGAFDALNCVLNELSFKPRLIIFAHQIQLIQRFSSPRRGEAG